MKFFKKKNNPFDALAKVLSKIPGLGPRSARRATFYLLSNPRLMSDLVQKTQEAYTNAVKCVECGNIDLQQPCSICADLERDQKTLCVVENLNGLWAIERSAAFHGLYHIINTQVSPFDDCWKQSDSFEKLQNRVENNGISEVLIATSPTLDGQTISHHLVALLSQYNVKLSRLAIGIPIGADLTYLDDSTLNLAIQSRDDVTK